MPKNDNSDKGPAMLGMPGFTEMSAPATRAAQQVLRLQLEMTTIASRRTRALLEVPRRYADCRSMEDLVAANTAFASDLWQDHLAAQQRMFAALMGLPAEQAADQNLAEQSVPSDNPAPAPARETEPVATPSVTPSAAAAASPSKPKRPSGKPAKIAASGKKPDAKPKAKTAKPAAVQPALSSRSAKAKTAPARRGRRG